MRGGNVKLFQIEKLPYENVLFYYQKSNEYIKNIFESVKKL